MTITSLSQRDPCWSSVRLGYSTEGQTIGSHGCLITALAMWLNSFQDASALQFTPTIVNADLMRTKNGYVITNLVNFGALRNVYPQIVYGGRIDCPLDPAPLGEIDAMLARGLPVIVYVDANRYVGGVQQHFVLVTGSVGNDYAIANPWNGKIQTLTPIYGDTAAHAVCGIIKFEHSAVA